MQARNRVSLIRRLGRGVWKLSKWLFVMACAAVAGAWGYVRYDYGSAAGQLDQRIQRAHELGLPLEPADMERHPPIAESENAAP